MAATRNGFPVPFFSPESALAVQTMGRKSGRQRITPMGYARVSGGRILVVAEHGMKSDWVRNALAAGEVTIWMAGKASKAEVVPRPDLDPALVRLQMPGRLLALANRALAHNSAVFEIRLR
ncbi:MAG: nitroreductase family deazaflavin-dependent oxidoreductase [Actinomycetota bacterium]